MEILIRAAMVLAWIIMIPLLVLALIGIVAIFSENNEEAIVSILWLLCLLFVIPAISWIATGSPVTIYAALVYFMQGGLLN